MEARILRGAAAAALCAFATLAGGCGGGGGADAANLAGVWSGSLTITFAGPGSLSGGIEMTLAQGEDFANGVATWAPIGEQQSVGGPVSGDSFELHLHFRCAEQGETAVLLGRVDGDSMSISGATGRACSVRGPATAVEGAIGTLLRTRDDLPL